MKHYHWIAMAIVFLTGSAHADQSTTELIERFGDYQLVATMAEEDIASSAEWDPDLGAPPLSVAEAIRAVRQVDLYQSGENAVVEIDLRPLPNHDGHWHYLIEVGNDAMSHKFNLFIVLMSGKVILANVEPPV